MPTGTERRLLHLGKHEEHTVHANLIRQRRRILKFCISRVFEDIFMYFASRYFVLGHPRDAIVLKSNRNWSFRSEWPLVYADTSLASKSETQSAHLQQKIFIFKSRLLMDFSNKCYYRHLWNRASMQSHGTDAHDAVKCLSSFCS